MSCPVVLTVGDTWRFFATLQVDGATFDMTAATLVRAALVSLDRTVVVAGPITCLASDTGAVWTASKVALVFPAALTALVAAGAYRVEVEVTQGGEPATWADQTVTVVQGAMA